uniref:Cyclin C-terminal domain-containing protein n=1 Tax=Arundo donax TaxID=35708 RepID=A0A0A9DYB1_ARUDO
MVFFTELALIEYLMVTFCRSMVAASTVYGARTTFSLLWTQSETPHLTQRATVYFLMGS